MKSRACISSLLLGSSPYADRVNLSPIPNDRPLGRAEPIHNDQTARWGVRSGPPFWHKTERWPKSSGFNGRPAFIVETELHPARWTSRQHRPRRENFNTRTI